MASLLITGDAGFVGSHTCLVLLDAGHRLVVLDNFQLFYWEPQACVELAQSDASDRLEVIEGIRSAADLERALVPRRSSRRCCHSLCWS